MNGDKDIFDRFDGHEEKLSSMPPPRVWERLEGRLDAYEAGQQRGKQWRIGRFMAVAASVALLVVAAYASSWLVNKAGTAPTAMHDVAGEVHWEEVEELSEAGAYYKAVALREAYVDGEPNFVGRRADGKRLAVNVKPRRGDVLSSVVASSEQQPSQPAVSESKSENTQVLNVPAERIEVAKEQNVVEEQSVAEERSEPDYQEATKPVGDAAIAAAPAYDEVASSSYQQVPSRAVAAKKSRATGLLGEVSRFEWLVGAWEGTQAASGASVERWQITGSNTLEGKGYVLSGNDTILTEGMRIEQTPEGVYYNLQSGLGANTASLKLTKYDGKVAIFEQDSIGFPNQVILQKNTPNNFTTILQAKEVPNNFNNMSSGQVEYLQQRNSIVPNAQQAIRNLNRVGEREK